MNATRRQKHKIHPAGWSKATTRLPLNFCLLMTAAVTLFASANCAAQASFFAATQTPKTATAVVKLPAPEKIAADFLKAAGGKKRLAAIKDATYEWSVEGQMMNAE